MASENTTKKRTLANQAIVKDWLTEDNLMLVSSWCRDGYTYQDIANRIGISYATLRKWRANYPEFEKALKTSREIIDYKVENALLKSALGYQTKEVRVTTTIRNGRTIETVKEVTDKEQSPNVSAIQCWLYNRLPDKWKKNRDNIIDLNEEDANIQVTITRASKNESHQKPEQSNNASNNSEVDEEWQEEVNQSITVRGKTEEEKKQDKKAKQDKAKAKAKEAKKNMTTKVAAEPEDLDYWPDDWEDED